MVEYTAGTAVFNDWIITRKIGQGATGHVYEIKKNGYGEGRRKIGFEFLIRKKI